MPRLKNLGVLKTANSENSKTVNQILFGRFLTILQRFAQKNVISNVVPKITKFIFCENRYKIVKNRPILIQLMVFKSSEFAVFKSPDFFNVGISSPKKPREIQQSSPLRREQILQSSNMTHFHIVKTCGVVNLQSSNVFPPLQLNLTQDQSGSVRFCCIDGRSMMCKVEQQRRNDIAQSQIDDSTCYKIGPT